MPHMILGFWFYSINQNFSVSWLPEMSTPVCTWLVWNICQITIVFWQGFLYLNMEQINNAGTNKGFRPLLQFNDEDIQQVPEIWPN